MTMTKEEILSQCVWDEYNFATLNVFSRMFNGSVEVRFNPEYDSGRRIDEKMVAALNDFLNLTESDLETVKDYLWQDCQESFASISYGVDVLEGETEAQANHRDFGIHSREDAYAKSDFSRVSIREAPEVKNNYAAIDFSPDWEREHGCSVIMKNGRLIAKYSNDVYCGQYEDVEESSGQAHEYRRM
jgi:hypothetical protein